MEVTNEIFEAIEAVKAKKRFEVVVSSLRSLD